ncbi:TonB-dependent receptor [Saprospira grandis]|uniref:TonB-dependent receptor n=1 Tax=Saprospira grandis TaxID=1008 RepID=UPI0022DE12DF|nr:TonB-dependent receptor [Saprospira grandis]WBM74324.1 TonB-dependent receptor [Saprospira grandis]
MQSLPYLGLVLLLFCFSSQLWSQEKVSLSGYLRDAETGEELLFANVAIPAEAMGVSTNEYGYYALSLPKGQYVVSYSYVGYQTVLDTIDLQADLVKDIELLPESTTVDAVVVTDERTDENVKSTDMSVLSLDMKEAKKVPVIFGEQDIVKTLQLMPGVSPSSEGGSGFFVRGGNADQNLILLDDAPVYNAAHLLGFFSVFNSDALKDVKLYKGGVPAEFGGRASSVMDVHMKNGNSKTFSGSGGLGLISSRLTLEGPIVKDKGSFIVSGRRTYADLMFQLVADDFDGGSLYFYDLNLKANYKLGQKDRLYLSGYFGRDVFGFDGSGLDWGNATLTLRWNHLFNEKLFANTTFVYSEYDYGFAVRTDNFDIDLSAGINNLNLKQDYSYYLNPNNNIKFGWQSLYYNFRPGSFEAKDSETDDVLGSAKLAQQYALENAAYISNQHKINKKLSMNYGLRLTSFSNIGATTVKTYNEANEAIDSVSYGSGEFFNTYFGLEPRVNAVYLLDDKSSIKASYNRIYQYLHILSNASSGTPTDIWAPSTPLIKPQYADQVALGYFRNFLDNKLEFSVEGYYKQLGNQVDYEDGAETFLNEDLEAELVFGQGRAYGMEVFLRKRQGKFTGWVSYTLSKSERQFADINNGNWFSARQDRRHDISVVGVYDITKKWSLSAAWVYYTGDAITFPSGKYEVDGQIVNLFSSRNGDRMPDYHRLDIGATYVFRDSKKWYSDINFSVYNAYNRKNAYSISFQENEAGTGTEAVRLALFGIVPSISWNFKF